MAVLPRTAEALPRPLAPRLPAALLGSVALIAVAALGLLQVMQTSRTVATGYELRALERERSQLAAEVRLLEAEVAQAARIDGVREEAMERLGMVAPQRAVRIAVDVAAPRAVPLPERYVAATAEGKHRAAPWWEKLLAGLLNFD